MELFYIITNHSKDTELKVTNQIKDYLLKCGKECIIDAGKKDENGKYYTDTANIPANVDCVIVLGGDGTLLQAAADLVDRDIPFLGINLGTLGFLAEVNQSGITNALDQLMADEYDIEKRLMLHGVIYEGHEIIDDCRALNDIVIARKGSLQIINFSIYVNGQLLHRYHGDGMIVATPTGSTGYSLSAGGPVVEPTADLMLLTPICPHSMQNRSIVLSPDDTIEIEIESNRDGSLQEVEAICDGSHKVTLQTGDRLVVKKSKKTTGIVKLSQVSFLEVLQRKLSD